MHKISRMMLPHKEAFAVLLANINRMDNPNSTAAPPTASCPSTTALTLVEGLLLCWRSAGRSRWTTLETCATEWKTSEEEQVLRE